jgi:hypothetical protein
LLAIDEAVFVECILDLELAGAFERVLNFTGDRRLASLFIDAIVYRATGKSPSTPAGVDLVSNLTHQHRGIGKYAIARKYLSVPDPGAWLFGTEYARAKGSPLNPAFAAGVGISALYIRRTGAWAAERALTGKLPDPQEIDSLPRAIRLSKLVES